MLNAENREEKGGWISPAGSVRVLDERYGGVCGGDGGWAFWKAGRAVVSLGNGGATRVLKVSGF